jgi:hypothetical protein
MSNPGPDPALVTILYIDPIPTGGTAGELMRWCMSAAQPGLPAGSSYQPALSTRSKAFPFHEAELRVERMTLPHGTSLPVDVNVVGDTEVEPDEGFTLALTSERGVTLADTSGQGTIRNDDAPAPEQPQPPAGDTIRPVVGVRGLQSRCARRSIRPRIRVQDASAMRTVRVFVDGRRVASRRSKRFALRIRLAGLKVGGHRLRVVATDEAGNRGSRTRVFRRCAAPRRAVRARFTG